MGRFHQRFYLSSPLLTALLLAGTLGAAGAEAMEVPASAPAPRPSGVAGRVLTEASPLPAAAVYAYQLADLSLQKVTTDRQGNFLFDQLPAGLYKIIVHKAGFLPAVVPLIRTTAKAYQFLELKLAEESRARLGDGIDLKSGLRSGLKPGDAAAAGDDFWAIRARIPGDVLRDIERDSGDSGRAEAGDVVARLDPRSANGAQVSNALLGQFHTEMQAMTGVDQIAAAGEGQVSSGKLGIEGHLGQVQVGLRGRFWQLDSPSSLGSSRGPAPGQGQSSAVSLDLERGDSSRVNVTGLNNRLMTRDQSDGSELPVDFAHYRVSWSQAVGQNARSEFAAQYTSESNFHRQGVFDPADIPESSRTWRVEGSYTTAPGPRSTLQTGIRYRERQYDLSGPPSQTTRALAGQPGQSDLDLFGNGGLRLQPSVLVEYGLYSTLSDGSLAMTPRGGVVLQLGKSWQMETSASRRVYDQVTNPLSDFLPTLYQESDLCEEGSESCYEVKLSHRAGEDDAISLGGVQRTVGKTLRLYFSDDVTDRLESIYLVPGDQLPEAHLSIGHRLGPKVVTTLESRVARGGGGTFHASDGRTYENRVEYLVTSLDTHFQSTSTGVFVAFHHLSQQLDPLDRIGGAAATTPNASERLQVVLTQDLNVLLDLSADWAVQLNMEVSRGEGADSLASADELRRRFLGGIAVRF